VGGEQDAVSLRPKLGHDGWRPPRVALLCALVALANGFVWSLIVPPFQVPDENAHYAYTQQVAERWTLPRQVLPEGRLSPAEDATLSVLGSWEMMGYTYNPAPFSTIQQRQIESVESEHLAKTGDGDALSATNNPPLYYMLAAVPYKLASNGTVLDRLTLMRLLSVLMGAGTVLIAYLFLMELLPGQPWAWRVGALVVAFQPLFSFISGGVNNDNLLYLAAAGMLWAIARIFRRGLTPRSGLLLGAFVGFGVLTKLTLLGMTPAAGLAVALGVLRSSPEDRPRALRGAAWAVGVAAAPVLVYWLLDRLIWRHGLVPVGVGAVSSAPSAAHHFNTREEISHIWQLFLFPIGMHHQFDYLPLWKTWFQGFFGRFGWLDYAFPEWFFWVALGVVTLVIVAAVGELVRKRVALRRRLGELAVYMLAVLGLFVEIGVESYRNYVQTNGGQFEQARYLLPLLCLYGAIAVLAVRFGGRRLGPVLAAFLIVLAVGHDLYAQVLTIGRYYT
jgi:4-amino-4-deoxy-L-arabinose transferase-like glycosyltransferase